MARRFRRSIEDVNEDTLALARKGPFTSSELAGEVGFSVNRARQVLDDLVKSRKLKEVGKRSSGRGKPAVLYGLPGTKVTEADLAPRATKGRKPARKSSAAAAPSNGAAGELMADLSAIFTLIQNYAQGVMVKLPSGQALEVRPLGTAEVTPATKRRSPARKKKAAAKKRSTAKRATKPKKKAAAKKRAPAKKAAKKKSTSGKKAAARKTAAKKKPTPKRKSTPKKASAPKTKKKARSTKGAKTKKPTKRSTKGKGAAAVAPPPSAPDAKPLETTSASEG